jgi:phospholipase/carboxylesterase
MLVTDFIPAADQKNQRLMVVLHGLGDSMEGYRWLPPTLKLPWLNYLLVNAPDGYYMGYSWYDFGGDPVPGIKRSRELLFNLLDEMREKNFPTEQTILFGFSQGCLLTHEVGLRYPVLLAGLVGVSGYAHEPEKMLQELSPVAKEQKFLITHGTHDALVPFNAVKEQMQMLKNAGIQIDWREFRKAHTIAGEDELGVIRDFVRARFGQK